MKFMCINQKSENGFTVLEVIIALVIVGVSITMFIKLLGSSSMMRGKIGDYDQRLAIAIEKTEEAFLGLLEDGLPRQEGKQILTGVIKGKNIDWKVEVRPEESSSGQGTGVRFYTVSVDGVEISSAGLR